LEVEQGISVPEAVQRVVECAVEDAVDSSLGHLEKGFRSLRTTKVTLKELREQYEKHHPRAAPEVLPTVESETTTCRASALIDEQMENLIRYWRARHQDVT
jgi:hypothetical protein